MTEMNTIINSSKALQVGAVLRRRFDEHYVLIKERKADDSGWWLVKRGGLADYVAEDDWRLVHDGPDFVRILRICDDMEALGVPKSALQRIREWCPL